MLLSLPTKLVMLHFKFYTGVCFVTPGTRVVGHLVPADRNWCKADPWITQHATVVVQVNV